MANIILETKELCKSYSDKLAVDHISMQVAQNSIYGLLGPNGAGKTTTMKMLVGMLRPTSGSMLFFRS